jgi:hypothetical protein
MVCGATARTRENDSEENFKSVHAVILPVFVLKNSPKSLARKLYTACVETALPGSFDCAHDDGSFVWGRSVGGG